MAVPRPSALRSCPALLEVGSCHGGVQGGEGRATQQNVAAGVWSGARRLPAMLALDAWLSSHFSTFYDRAKARPSVSGSEGTNKNIV